MRRRGTATAVAKCGVCHRTDWPDEYTAAKWPGIVKNMGKLMKLKEPQMADLDAYLVPASQYKPAQ